MVDHSLFPSPHAWHREGDNSNIVLALPECKVDLMHGALLPELLSPLRTLDLVERFRSQSKCV